MKDLKITTNYNENLVKKYMIDHFFIHTRKVKIFINIIIIICTILTIILMTYKITNLYILCLIIYLLGFIEFNTSILPKRSFKKLKKSSNLIINSENTYIFNEENITIKSNNCTSKINYQDIYKCIEVTQAYYIYITDRQAFIVDKKQINIKEEEKLKQILSSKIKNYLKINK